MPAKQVIVFLVSIAAAAGCGGGRTGPCRSVERPPIIDPDYAGIVIPPNMAPLNFIIRESGRRYAVKIYAEFGDTIRIKTGGPRARVAIPIGQWKRLLRLNRGRTLTIDIAGECGGRWSRFRPVVNRIAADDIDGYLVYRAILGHKSIPEMSIRQRHLEDFGERTVLDNRTLSARSLACINCHSFRKYGTDDMIIHLRGKAQGMLLVKGKNAMKIDTRTAFNKGPASYASWHPSGRLIAFATMKVNQTLHSTGDPRVVLDEASDLIIYDVRSNAISTSPSIADPARMETLPEWSPDGRYLYFCSAPQPPKADDAFYAGMKYRDIRYDILRVGFDSGTGAWGGVDTVVSSAATGLSNVQPKLSPDGRFLLFVTMPYSYFAVYSDESDLWLKDLSSGTCRRLDGVNSASTESFHSWSSNGRWFVVNSRRRDGMCGLPYFAFVDTAGNVSKPFLLPQKDPAFYATLLKSFNVPVLVREPVRVGWRELSRAAGDSPAARKAFLDERLQTEPEAGTPLQGAADGYVP